MSDGADDAANTRFVNSLRAQEHYKTQISEVMRARRNENNTIKNKKDEVFSDLSLIQSQISCYEKLMDHALQLSLNFGVREKVQMENCPFWKEYFYSRETLKQCLERLNNRKSRQL